MHVARNLHFQRVLPMHWPDSWNRWPETLSRPQELVAHCLLRMPRRHALCCS